MLGPSRWHRHLFVLARNPMLPARQGELQAFGLGLDACALDRETRAVVGEKAEFVPAPARRARVLFGDDDAKTKHRKATSTATVFGTTATSSR